MQSCLPLLLCLTRKAQNCVAFDIALAIAGFGFVSAGRGTDTGTSQSTAVARGDIQISTSADGHAVVDSATELNFISGGTVAAIYVKDGQSVTKGQKLARLDSRKLSYQVTQAKAGYTAAVAKLNSLKDGPSDVEVESKRVAVENAKTAAQAAYGYAKSENDAGRVPQDQLLAKEAQLNSAKSQLRATEAQLNIALDPANSNEIASARALANQASAAIKVASVAVDEATLRSPADGAVLAINKAVGESVGAQSAPAEPFMVIGNTARMTIEAQVEEIDIAKVSIGQKVKATFDALEGRE
ncbi:MAG: HlyD family secretion protein, partial [Candidatus Aquicultor sp.]